MTSYSHGGMFLYKDDIIKSWFANVKPFKVSHLFPFFFAPQEYQSTKGSRQIIIYFNTRTHTFTQTGIPVHMQTHMQTHTHASHPHTHTCTESSKLESATTQYSTSRHTS